MSDISFVEMAVSAQIAAARKQIGLEALLREVHGWKHGRLNLAIDPGLISGAINEARTQCEHLEAMAALMRRLAGKEVLVCSLLAAQGDMHA